MKTAMQKLIDEINHVFRNNKIDHVTHAVNDIIEIIKTKGIEDEKNNIIDAVEDTELKCVEFCNDVNLKLYNEGDRFRTEKNVGVDYYRRTFIQNK
jgi:hypothetical protein